MKISDCKRWNIDEFIQAAQRIHDERYIYDKSIYIDNKTKLEIGCRVEGHGYFWQTPNNHLSGTGCPMCLHKSEALVKIFLESILPNEVIIHDRVYSPMGNRRPDFRIPSLNLIIEYDGQQHFRDIVHRTPCQDAKRIDVWKAIIAIRNGYSVMRIPYTFLKDHQWKEKLAPYIKSYNTPRVIYINGSSGIYDDHKLLLAGFKDKPDQLLE